MEENVLNQEIKPVIYAGFWLRFVASLIDGIILWLVQMIITAPLLGIIGVTALKADSLSHEESLAAILAIIGVGMVTYMVIIVMGWLYFALMESYKGATIGKMAMGLKVTDMNGNQINFLRATGRYFGKIVSSMILMIGYIMAGFTEKKQALHDMMANCLVVKK